MVSNNSTKSENIQFQEPRINVLEPVAIIGVGAIMPDALNSKEFWENITSGKNSITEVDSERWDPKLYYNTDKGAPDKTYTKIGGFVKNFEFNGLNFRIPPNMAKQIDPLQQLALTAAKEALEDANYENKNFNRENTAVILGNSMGGEVVREYTRRVYFPEVVETLRETPEFSKLESEQQVLLLENLEKQYKSRFREINEDSMPGELANVIAGRIANVFNLRGKNLTTDAACASSMAAIDEAYKSLISKEVDVVLCGGADRSMDVSTYVKFCKIGALSPDGSYPFDERANGFVMGEGVGFFVLKRLSDAISHGDKIYALVRGVGSSSDGRGKGITAPNPIGQELAIRRALKAGKVSPHEISLIEAHGTSTKVGDVVEVDTISKVFMEDNVKLSSIPIGSIKSQIGHLKSAAGAAAIIKVALAIYNKVLPPSINFENPNPNIDWEKSPFYVNTKTKKWECEGLRTAGVSSFGFGGTNFHVVMQEYNPNYSYDFENTKDYEDQVIEFFVDSEFASEPIFLSAETKSELINQVNKIRESIPDERDSRYSLLNLPDSFNPMFKERVALAPKNIEELQKELDMVQTLLDDSSNFSFYQKRGIFYSDTLPEGKTVFMFPGQGSQYVNMLKELSTKFPIVKKTISEADEVLFEFLGEPLSGIIYSKSGKEKELEEKLKQTQFTQPAMLLADIAVFRLLQTLGVEPDMVAGHSLGEYAALVAANVLSFSDALKAVAVRGKAMANVDASDKGSMASVNAPYEKIEEILKTIDDYVIPANKNSTTSTVISGSTVGIEKAIKVFSENGISCVKLNVSAAFHSEIVAPAAQELAEFLRQITFNKPTIPVSSNVLGELFPEDPEKIRSLLEKQVESAVEWVQQINNLYKNGGRIFVEVGPKRALSSFVETILSDENSLTLITVHPKKGETKQLNEALAGLFAAGKMVIKPSIEGNLIDKSIYDVKVATPTLSHFSYSNKFTKTPQVKEISPQIRTALTKDEFQGEIQHSFNSDNYITADAKYDPMFKSYLQFQGDLLNKFVEESFNRFKQESSLKLSDKISRMGINLDNIVVTGTGVGLPGKYKEIFDSKNIQRIFRGENLIDQLSEVALDEQTDKNIVKLVKRDKGSPTLDKINKRSDVIKLAAQPGKFDLVAEFQLAEKLIETYDSSTKLAIAAGLEALKDAYIPLQREYVKTTTGSYLPGDWVLPKELQDDTGVIFASAFPGFDSLVDELTRYYKWKKSDDEKTLTRIIYSEIHRKLKDSEDKERIIEFIENILEELESNTPEYIFNRKFLFRILSMGHSQFAQLIKARGPNTQVNAACASTTQAVGIAQDWIRNGRCKRVIIIGSDNVTSDHLFPWIGSGFLSSGAATTEGDVTKAALPFDERRHGMIVGMGAVGLVIETEEEAKRRGIAPIAQILSSHYANSAFHGTRLDVTHISSEFEYFFKKVTAEHALTPEEISESCIFMSHETYTPARGGSAAAEIESLRHVFGDHAQNIFITNTKGFTGHPMGAGIEDAIALKTLEFGVVPPIANLKQPDPALGNLKFGDGQKHDITYAIRLAAGFGSQLAFVLYKKASYGSRKTMLYGKWLKSIGSSEEDLIEVGKTLRVKENPSIGSFQETVISTRETPVDPKVSKLPKSLTVSNTIKHEVNEPKTPLGILSMVTGYPPELLTNSLNLITEIGMRKEDFIAYIDESTLKNLSDEEFTVQKILELLKPLSTSPNRQLSKMDLSKNSSSTKTTSIKTQGQANKQNSSSPEVLMRVLEIVAEKTGYPKEMLDPELDMEADLGIDTVKQAELFGIIRESFEIPLLEDLDLSEYNTIKKISEFVIEQISKDQSMINPTASSSKPIDQHQASLTDSKILNRIIERVSEQTGYPVEMLEPDLDMEADLGIDTVKQAELIGIIREEFGIPLIDDLDISQYNTIQKISEFVKSNTERPTEETVNVIVEGPGAKTKKKNLRSSVNEDILSQVIQIVAEKTGYPVEMLEPDLDMEADLGIDTVKQAELIGVIRDNFGIPLIEDLDISQYNTINRVAEFVIENTTEASKITEHNQIEQDKNMSKSPEVKSDISTPISADEVLSTVTNIVSEKTGYPETMLEPDLDMEADLGIDTVKQAELIGVIREKFGIPLIEDLDISQYSTIRKVTQFVKDNLQGSKVIEKQNQTIVHSQNTKKDTSLDFAEEIKSKTLGLIIEITGYPPELLDLKLNLRTDLGLTEPDIETLFNRLSTLFDLKLTKIETGLTVGNLLDNIRDAYSSKSESIPKSKRFTLDTVDITPTNLDLSVFTFLAHNGEGISELNLINSIPNSLPKNLVLLNIDENLITDIPSFFDRIKNDIDDILSLNLISINSETDSINKISPLEGAIGGMLKALKAEFSKLKGSIIVSDDIKTALQYLNHDLTEILVSTQSAKATALLENGDLSPESIKLPESPTLLVTGGAQGITFETTSNLIKRFKNPKIIVIGRTKVLSNAEDLSTYDSEQLKKFKSDLLQKLKSKNDKVTPVLLENEYSKFIKSANVYKSMKKYQESGASVLYISCDITNQDEVREAIKVNMNELDIDHFNIVIHGAGIEISRPTKQKSKDEFSLVYNTKVLGYQSIEPFITEDTDRVILFTSVAGRFGNATQVDYSAANEYLTKTSDKLRSRGIESTAIDWSAWSEVGMATRGSTMTVLSMAGVTPISPQEGVKRFLDEFFYGNETEVVISGELGKLLENTPIKKGHLAKHDRQDSIEGVEVNEEISSKRGSVGNNKNEQSAKFEIPSTISSKSEVDSEYPMIDFYSIEGGIPYAGRLLSLSRDLYLDHHRIDDKAVLPGVMGLETIIEFVQRFDGIPRSLVDVSFESPIKLPRDQPLEVFVIPEESNELMGVTHLHLKSKFIGPDGKQLGDLRDHFRVGVIEGKSLPAMRYFPEEMNSLISQEGILMQKAQIYDLFFHGPKYQVIDFVASLSENSILTKIDTDTGTLFNNQDAKVSFQPLLIEACFQTAGLYGLLQKGVMSLPSKVRKVQHYTSDLPATYVFAIFLAENSMTSLYNVYAFNEKLELVCELREFEMIHTGKSPVTHSLKISEDEIEVALLEHQLYKLSENGVVLSTKVLEDINEDVLDSYFTKAGKVLYSRLKVKKRRMEWSAGQIAAKRAISIKFNLPEDEIEIVKDEMGKPKGVYQGVDFPVTISHSNGYAIAVSDEYLNLGFDLEKVEERDKSFIKTAFTKNEIEEFSIEPEKIQIITQLWSIKESAMKAKGTGLKAKLKSTKVQNGHSTHKYSVLIGDSKILVKSSVNDKWAMSLAIMEETKND